MTSPLRPELETLRLPAKTENIRRLIRFVSEQADRSGFSGKRILEIELAIDEAVANICRHAYGDDEGDVEIRCCPDKAEGKLLVEIIDAGAPFNPLSWSEQDLTSGLDDRKAGGLGVYLIKRIADKLEYRREGDRNILRITVGAGEFLTR